MHRTAVSSALAGPEPTRAIAPTRVNAAVVTIGVFLLVCRTSLPAATITVTTAADSGPGSLRQAILDSNVTTAITSVFLIAFGSEDVKGFGLTLLIGILTSLFSALYVTRTIFAVMLNRFGLKHLGSLPLTFRKWNDLLHPKIDWQRRRDRGRARACFGNAARAPWTVLW